MKKALVIGSSRGLGAAILNYLQIHIPEIEKSFAVSRKPVLAQAHVKMKLDMSITMDQMELSQVIEREAFDVVFYCAGGGPHGEFARKDFKDHEWALQMGLVAPMRLALSWLKVRPINELGRFVIVGSRIAESQPDPLASSYAAAKHGLMGFVSSLQSELTGNSNQVWLFSPGYMDSEMLPVTAKVRHDGSKLMSVDTAAQACLRWIKKEGPWHRVLN